MIENRSVKRADANICLAREGKKEKTRKENENSISNAISIRSSFLVADHQSVLRFNRYQINREIQLVI